MRLVIVEPHPDDAFLSLGWHLERVWADSDRMILTVFAGRKRADEGRAYAETIGASHQCLYLSEVKMLSESRPKQVPELVDTVSKLIAAGWDTFVFPIGLQHPDHLSVAASRPSGALRYLDTPYQTKQKLADTLLLRSVGMTVKSVLFPPARKWRHTTIFKSQAKFFHFNARLKESLLPEIVLCPQ